jgi:prepilin-type N-terminal cleavage/methylation domain-containing protein/prepilin-type processing-associated H-X9-DG protein
MNTNPTFRRCGAAAFTLIEVLVAIAIIIVLSAVSYPIVTKWRLNGQKIEAIHRMEKLAGAVATYAAQNGGDLPEEDAEGKDTWAAAAKPGAAKAWYNALPKILGQKSVADFVNEGRTAAFYEKENILHLPGANYPESQRATRPYFAIAINTKLHRKDPADKGDRHAKKPTVKLSNVQVPSRTVVFLEQGLPKEKKAHDSIRANDYDGSCKGSAKSFVARYGEKGIVAFLDGHCELVSGKDILDNNGQIIWDPANAAAIFWTPDPKEDPNN